MTDITDQELHDYREQAENTQDEPLSEAAMRPGWQRAKVLSVRLSEDEFEELSGYAATLEVPASALVRGVDSRPLAGRIGFTGRYRRPDLPRTRTAPPTARRLTV